MNKSKIYPTLKDKDCIYCFYPINMLENDGENLFTGNTESKFHWED